MNIHKSQLFWCELQGYYWFWHTAISHHIWLCLKIVYPYTQWFCWSLSLLFMAIIGGIPHFQTYPSAISHIPCVSSTGVSAKGRALETPSTGDVTLVLQRPSTRVLTLKRPGHLEESGGCSRWSGGWSSEILQQLIPSGKHTNNYGKFTIFHGKTHYFYGHVQ